MYDDFAWVPEAPKTPEQIALETLQSSAPWAGCEILSTLSIARNAVEQENNYIALMEFDRFAEEAIEKLTALRSFAVERVSHIRNLSLLEAA